MLVIGIVITIISALMAIFPDFFMKLKSPLAAKKYSTKVRAFVRIWGLICIVIGVSLIIAGII